MINIGYIEATVDDVAVRIYYDATVLPAGDTQPLIDGPRGYCLDITNPAGRNRGVEITLPGGAVRTITIGVGDPVTSGAGRSRTAAALATWGYTTRGDVAGLKLG